MFLKVNLYQSTPYGTKLEYPSRHYIEVGPKIYMIY